MECLITKLKAEVNNPNLPILETIQQTTLEAIAASGNTSMTDAQKYALNHFFYQLGAMDNSGLWGKIDGIILPFLANDAEHSIVNYKTNSIYNTTLERTFNFSSKGICVLSSGGVAQYHDLFEYEFDAADFSLVNIISNAGVSTNLSNLLSTTVNNNNDAVNVGKRTNNTSYIVGMFSNGITTNIYRWYNNTYTGTTSGYAFSFGTNDSDINGYYLNTNKAITAFASKPSYNSETSYPSYANSIFRVGQQYTFGCIVGKAMTADELTKVFSNLIELRAAFVDA